MPPKRLSRARNFSAWRRTASASAPSVKAARHNGSAQKRKASVLLSADHEPRYAEAAKAIAEIMSKLEVSVVPDPWDQGQFRATLAGLVQAARRGGEAKNPAHR